jgi:hypothetical protein
MSIIKSVNTIVKEIWDMYYEEECVGSKSGTDLSEIYLLKNSEMLLYWSCLLVGIKHCEVEDISRRGGE